MQEEHWWQPKDAHRFAALTMQLAVGAVVLLISTQNLTRSEGIKAVCQRDSAAFRDGEGELPEWRKARASVLAESAGNN
jgi:hypothetical protein